MAIKAKRFTIGWCIAAAFANGSAMVCIPSSAFAFVMIAKDKLLSATFTFAVGVVKDFSLHFIGKSHCWFSFKKVLKSLPFRSHALVRRCYAAFYKFYSRMRANVRILQKNQGSATFLDKSGSLE